MQRWRRWWGLAVGEHDIDCAICEANIARPLKGQQFVACHYVAAGGHVLIVCRTCADDLAGQPIVVEVPPWTDSHPPAPAAASEASTWPPAAALVAAPRRASTASGTRPCSTSIRRPQLPRQASLAPGTASDT